MEENDFKNSKYYELFINNGNDYDTYWMSSRCVDANSDCAHFYVCLVRPGYVDTNGLFYSDGKEGTSGCAFRPIITLKSNVQIDVQNDKDGSTPEKAYSIK